MGTRARSRSSTWGWNQFKEQKSFFGFLSSGLDPGCCLGRWIRFLYELTVSKAWANLNDFALALALGWWKQLYLFIPLSGTKRYFWVPVGVFSPFPSFSFPPPLLFSSFFSPLFSSFPYTLPFLLNAYQLYRLTPPSEWAYIHRLCLGCGCLGLVNLGGNRLKALYPFWIRRLTFGSLGRLPPFFGLRP